MYKMNVGEDTLSEMILIS